MASMVLSHIHDFRVQQLPNDAVNIQKLENLDLEFFRLPKASHSDVPSRRVDLLKTIAQNRHVAIFSKVFSLQSHNAKVSALSLEVTALQDLSKVLKHWFHNKSEIQKALDALPLACRNKLYWAVWFNKGAPTATDFGKQTLESDLNLLWEKLPPVLHMKGDNLVEQLLSYTEQQLSFEKEKEICDQLHKIAEMLHRPVVPAQAVTQAIKLLPESWQQKLQQEVSQFSSKYSVWNKKKNLEDPSILIRLRNPDYSESNLLDHYITAQEKHLEKMHFAIRLEEFDRISSIYNSLSPAQQDALKGSTSPKVLQWIAACNSSGVSSSEPRPLYEERGAHVTASGTVFRVYAPNAKNMTLILTAFGNEEHRISMKKLLDGTWEMTTPLAQIGRTYRYEVEETSGRKIYRIDPFSFSTLESKGTIESVVTDLQKHQWHDAAWMEKRSEEDPLKKPLSIYELHIESWKKNAGSPRNFRDTAPELISYCKKMQFTHVEIYGILENGGGWGYQVNNFFSPNHRLGCADDFKCFVDQLHQNGIGVIIDWIPAHYNANPNEASLHNFDGTDLFSAKPSPWGTLYFDFTKPEAKRLMKASCMFWLKEMHVDGLRVDAVSPMIRNPGGSAFLQEANKEIHKLFPGVLTIAEETDGFPDVTKSDAEKSGGLGFDLKWWTPWSFASRYFIQTPLNARCLNEHFNDKITHHLHDLKWNEKVVLAHSHDDVANPSGDTIKPSSLDQTLYKLDACSEQAQKFADMRNFFAWQILSPSRGHLIHMGDEIGQRRSPNALFSEAEGGVEWHLLDSVKDPIGKMQCSLQEYVSDLNRLYCEKKAFWNNGEQGLEILAEHQKNCVLAYQKNCEGEPSLLIVHNFSDSKWKSYDIPIPKHIKNMREIFNSDAAKYGGTGDFLNPLIKIDKDQMTIALPPMSSLVFEECEE